MSTDEKGPRERITKAGEDALGKFAQDLLENPLVTGALTRAFEAREKAVQAQEVAMGALNIPSAADIERLTRRVRSVSQRLEGIEDGVDRVDERMGSLTGSSDVEQRLARMEAQLDELVADVAAIRDTLSAQNDQAEGSDKRLGLPAE
jgi:septal ring factor EnvC (AmiA/AmiB activator)